MNAQVLEVIGEIWDLVSEHIPEGDLPDITENIVGILLDNDFDIEDIKYQFSNDSHMIDAVSYHGEFADSYEEEFDDYEHDIDKDSDEDEDW